MKIATYFFAILSVWLSIYSGAWAYDEAWVREKIVAYPELSWLADKKVAVTHDIQAKHEPDSKTPPSVLVYDGRYDEFDRSILGLVALDHVSKGTQEGYEAFVSAQAKDDLKNPPLSYEQYSELHQKYLGLLKSGLARQDMEIALVLGDMGKTTRARTLFGPEGVKAADHDIFLREALMKRPELFPSYEGLTPLAKKLLPLASGLVHIGHITHIEGGVEMFEPLAESGILKTHPLAMDFDGFVHLMDVAGSAGQVVPWSSVVLTSNTYKAITGIDESFRVLRNGGTPQEALSKYVELRGKWLGLTESETQKRYAGLVVRLGANLRRFDPESGKVIKDTFLSLPEESRKEYEERLSPTSPLLPANTPTYIPAVFSNLSRNETLGEASEERLAGAVKIGLPFIYKVLSSPEVDAQRTIRGGDPINFNTAAKFALSENAAQLKEASFSLDGQNQVLVYAKK